MSNTGHTESSGTKPCVPATWVTHEEHSTRGRAHPLWEMMQGDVLTGGWRSDQVREALDLCLSCKACESECPVNVDVPTYKAEFLAHHYPRRVLLIERPAGSRLWVLALCAIMIGPALSKAMDSWLQWRRQAKQQAIHGSGAVWLTVTSISVSATAPDRALLRHFTRCNQTLSS